MEYVLRTVEERGVRFVRLWFTDVLGQLKSFAISPAELESAFDDYQRLIYGLLLFIMANISGAPLRDIVRDTLPFLAAMIAALGLMTFVPAIVLWLPRLMGYQG